MTTVFVVLGYSIAVIFDMIPLLKNGKKKEKLLYTSILVLSFVLSILLSLEIKVPSPIPFYEKVIMSLKQGVL